jgi:hypothetical protein
MSAGRLGRAVPWCQASRRFMRLLSRRRVPADLVVCLALGLLCLLVYNANGRVISSGDNTPARFLPFVLWHHHAVTLDPTAPMTPVAKQGYGEEAYWWLPIGGRLVSLYPITLPVLVAPFYLPAVLHLDRASWTEARLDHMAALMEKATASAIAAASVVLVYLTLRRRLSAGNAALLAVAYAFGTTTWMIGSQALWQHGLGQLLVAVALFCFTAPSTPWRAVVVGLACALLACNRPPDIVLAVPLGVYGLWWAGRRSALQLIAAGALPLLALLAYNVGFANHLVGGYGRMGHAEFFRHNPVAGLAGLLFSPTKGLLVFSPFLLFLVLAIRHRPEDRRLAWAAAVGVALQVALYSFIDWRGGVSWGPRFLTDLLPLLVWFLGPVVASLRGLRRFAFVAAVAVGTILEAIGAFFYTGAADLPVLAVANGPHAFRAAWHWKNAPFVASLRDEIWTPDLWSRVQGSVDGLEVDGIAAQRLVAGRDASVVGWAMTNHTTPSRVVAFLGGREIARTLKFFDRGDARAAMGVDQPLGWRLALPPDLAAGTHSLAFFVFPRARGLGRLLATREVIVEPPPADDLATSFARAAERLLLDQQPSGAWHTAHTTTPRYQDPQPEMNVYLTALLHDLLEPVAASAGLGESLARSRVHLAQQVERVGEVAGLVRYHGLPDGPGMGVLGCPITPDTDDTALVWRIAPPADRRLLTQALRTIERYRTDQGLYRTWLAPRADYQCLDPGSDPNPADATIQMHLLQLLAIERPARARSLCGALRDAVARGRGWIYYERAPLVPMLRLPDLERAGCALSLPEARTHSQVPGQEIWIEIAHRLGRSPSLADNAEAGELLARLARNDFEALRADPPLLYHNDLTATVSRHYWSEDVGYALWLRLAERLRQTTDDPSRSGAR